MQNTDYEIHLSNYFHLIYEFFLHVDDHLELLHEPLYMKSVFWRA